MAGILACGLSRAGPLSTEPSIGLSSEYASNQYLLARGGRAVLDEAILFNAPTHYDVDSMDFTLAPSVRYSNSGSYASLASNYFHLNGSAAFASELNSLSFTNAFGRDSSLQQNGLSSNGIGVRSDGTSAGLDWQRTMTERAVVEFDAGWTRVLYNQGATATGLVDYRYINAGAAASYAISERDRLQISVSAGRYSALDGITASENYYLQLGFDRQLTEIWKLSTTAGYAKSDNSMKLYYGPFFIGNVEYGPYYIGTAKSQQQGPIYSASMVRRGEQLDVTLSASRNFRPSGFEFLSREDIAAVDLSYTRSERWKFGARVNYQDTATPLSSGAIYAVHYLSGQMSANWNWTPTWTISLHANWVNVKYDLPPVGAQSTGVSLQIVRQFLRIQL